MQLQNKVKSNAKQPSRKKGIKYGPQEAIVKMMLILNSSQEMSITVG